MFQTSKTKTILKISSIAALAVALVVCARFAYGATTPDTSKEINQLNQTIQDRKKQLDALRNKQEEYSRALAKKQAEKASLQNQIAIVDTRLAGAQVQLDQVQVDIETTNLEIQKIALEISQNNDAINENKEQLSSAIRLLSQEGEKSQLEILLLNNYLTEYITQVQYLEDINGKISEGLTDLKAAKLGLDESKLSLETNKEKLRTLRGELEQNQVQLASEKDMKSYLLDETRSSEAEYQKLLNQARKEQQSAAADIVSLERSVRNKISQQGGNKLPLKYDGFIWPVPSHRITATFHDPSYPFRNVFEHPAVDIATPQGTPIKAAASGYVGRAKNGGMGYSYIMLVHGDGLATVYGHVSKIYVKEDEYVTQGQIIGLSGALPGTPGAGPLTTGPHLHLEVRLNGIPVDPQNYLP